MDSSLSRDAIQPLLTASSSSASLEEALQNLIETSKTDAGRSDLASKCVLLKVLRLLQLLTYHSSRVHLIHSLKLLRNLCAGEIANQNSFIDQNGTIPVSDVLSSAIQKSDHEMVRFGLQLLSNVALGGVEHQRAVWAQFFPEKLVELARIRRKDTCDPLCKVVYICCDGSDQIGEDLCSGQGLILMAEIVRTASSVGFREDWLKLLLSRVCVEDIHFPQLFSKLSQARSSEKDEVAKTESFSSEQAVLLRIVSNIVNERIREISVPKDTALFILEIFKRSIAAVNLVSGEKSELPTGSTDINVMGYALTITRDICADESLEEPRKENNLEDLADALSSSGLIELLLDLLRDLEPPTLIKKALKQTKSQERGFLGSSKRCPYKGFRTDIVAVMGNCAHRRKHVQDKIRERDGILLILQQCVIDDDNPFLREWGIWCMRNLLEGNKENQRAVTDLEIQGSVNLPELAGLGLKVEVDPKTQRPKLVNVP